MAEWLFYNNTSLEFGGLKIEPPIVLPASTIRFQFSDPSFDPTEVAALSSDKFTWSAANSAMGIWDATVTATGTMAFGATLFASMFTPTNLGAVTVAILDGNVPVNLVPPAFPVFALFGSCTSITSASLTCDNTAMFKNMFSGCSALTSATVRTTLSAAQDTSSMFYNCSALSSITLTGLSLSSASSMFNGCTSLAAIPSLNTGALTNAGSMFNGCTSLTAISSLVMSALTNAASMFRGCTGLTSLPLLNTSTLTNVSQMFDGCVNVQSGALALYQQMSTQTTPPSTYTNCFRNCGSNTTTGAAELDQIPTTWGGTVPPENS